MSEQTTKMAVSSTPNFSALPKHCLQKAVVGCWISPCSFHEGAQNGTLVNGSMDENLRSPGLSLSQTHINAHCFSWLCWNQPKSVDEGIWTRILDMNKKHQTSWASASKRFGAPGPGLCAARGPPLRRSFPHPQGPPGRRCS